MKILIAEDDFVSLKLLNRYLSALGEINNASNGTEAISAVKSAIAEDHPFDLICLDIMMPEVDGLHALTKIREIENQEGLNKDTRSKIIMTTALSDKDSVVEAVKAECDAYIIKPVTKARLIDEIQKFGFKIPE